MLKKLCINEYSSLSFESLFSVQTNHYVTINFGIRYSKLIILTENLFDSEEDTYSTVLFEIILYFLQVLKF